MRLRLAAALYVYLLGRLDNAGPLWKGGESLMQEEAKIQEEAKTRNVMGPLQRLVESVEEGQ